MIEAQVVADLMNEVGHAPVLDDHDTGISAVIVATPIYWRTAALGHAVILIRADNEDVDAVIFSGELKLSQRSAASLPESSSSSPSTSDWRIRKRLIRPMPMPAPPNKRRAYATP